FMLMIPLLESYVTVSPDHLEFNIKDNAFLSPQRLANHPLFDHPSLSHQPDLQDQQKHQELPGTSPPNAPTIENASDGETD
ncbi:hypothetical protein HK102_011826, partial [Quaeritorhiza haematococci]